MCTKGNTRHSVRKEVPGHESNKQVKSNADIGVSEDRFLSPAESVTAKTQNPIFGLGIRSKCRPVSDPSSESVPSLRSWGSCVGSAGSGVPASPCVRFPTLGLPHNTDCPLHRTQSSSELVLRSKRDTRRLSSLREDFSLAGDRTYAPDTHSEQTVMPLDLCMGC